MSEKLSPGKAYSQIAGMFGEENIFLNPRDIPPVETTPSGSPALDRALGVGGYPLGRIMQIAGTPSAGKTQLTLIAAAEWMALDRGNCACFIDAEYTYDPDWAESLGVDNERMLLIKTNAAEKIFTGLVGKTTKTAKTIKHAPGLLGMIENGQTIQGKNARGEVRSFDLSKMRVIIVDSVASMNTPTEESAIVGKQNVASMARFLTTELKKLTPAVAKANVALFGINHVKTAIGVMYGDPTTTPGGRAWHHACSVQIMVATINKKEAKIFNQHDEQIGHTVRAKITKNKCAPPFKKAEYSIEYVVGMVKQEEELFEAGILENLFERPNNRTYIYRGQSITGKDKFIEHIKENFEQVEADLRASYLDGEISDMPDPGVEVEVIMATNTDELF